MQLSIIIVSFNTEDLLVACLNSLFNHYRDEINHDDYEIIVVDNASSDGSVEYLRQHFPKVRVIENKTNLGFAKANNIGIKASVGKNKLLLNPDTVVPKGTLTTMVAFMGQYPDAGIATCKVQLINGELDDAWHRGFPTSLRALFYFTGLANLFPQSQLFNGYHLGYRQIDKIHEIDACVGAFLMIKRQVGEQVGWLDEDYFWYGDDLDLCFRVKAAGFKVMYVPSVSITHHKGVSSGLKKHSQYLSQATREIKLRATQARFEVMRIFYKKHYLKLYPWWLTQLVFLGISLKQKLAHFTV